MWIPKSCFIHFKPYSTVLFSVCSSCLVLKLHLLELDKLSLGKKDYLLLFLKQPNILKFAKLELQNFLTFLLLHKQGGAIEPLPSIWKVISDDLYFSKTRDKNLLHLAVTNLTCLLYKITNADWEKRGCSCIYHYFRDNIFWCNSSSLHKSH